MKALTREQKLKIAIQVVEEEWKVINNKRNDEYIDRAFGIVSDWLNLCQHNEKQKRRRL